MALCKTNEMTRKQLDSVGEVDKLSEVQSDSQATPNCAESKFETDEAQ